MAPAKANRERRETTWISADVRLVYGLERSRILRMDGGSRLSHYCYYCYFSSLELPTARYPPNAFTPLPLTAPQDASYCCTWLDCVRRLGRCFRLFVLL